MLACMSIINFIIPFWYTLRYNRKGLEGVAFSLEYYAFPFVVLLSFGENFAAVNGIDLVAVLFFAVLIYEIGYIHNNVIAIKGEDNPTIRHSRVELRFAENWLFSIILIRVSFSLLFVLYFLFSGKYFVALAISLVGAGMLSVFILYNNVRLGAANRFLFFVLRFLRYFLVLIPFGFSLTMLLLSLAIGALNYINNFAWYPKRSSASLPRFFGTKLFDFLVYLLVALFCFVFGWRELSYVFFYLSFVKVMLFGLKVCSVLGKKKVDFVGHS